MNKKTHFAAVCMAVTAILLSSAIAMAGGHDGPGKPHKKRPRNYHHEHVDRPLATLALCVLYPKKCTPRPVIVKTHQVVIVKHPVIVKSPDTGKSVYIEIDDLSEYSGGWWDKLSEYNKLQFVKVYVQLHEGANASLFKGKSYSDFVEKLDAFYRSSGNQSLSVDMALDVVTLKMNSYLEYGNCMNGYYVMTASDNLFDADMINAKYDECSNYDQPEIE